MASPNVSSRVGAVAIGRNEGERLRDCVTSLKRDVEHVVYVDSGSTDDSMTIAKSLGAAICELDPQVGFTAARARNRGTKQLCSLAGDVEFIQFVDGDCEVVAGWIEDAVAFLDEHPDVALVCGRRRERNPRKNWYHRLADIEWDTPVGQAKYCGGDALVRTTALRQVDGYRESLIAGEEPELCVRLRQAGWQIWRLDREMTLHDIRMNTFRQWWRRALRSGHAYAEGAALHGRSPQRHFVHQTRSVWFWGFLVPLVGIVVLLATNIWMAFACMGLLYALLCAKIVRFRLRSRQDCLGDALLYAGGCILAKFPQFVGQASYWYNRLARIEPQIIEYNQTSFANQDAITSQSKDSRKPQVNAARET